MPVAVVASPSLNFLVVDRSICQNRFHRNYASKRSTFFSLCFFCSPYRALPFSARKIEARRQIRVSLSGDGDHVRARRFTGRVPSVDACLEVAELLCIAPPAIYSIGCLVSFLVFNGVSKKLVVPLDSKVFVMQFVLLVGAVAIGVVIRGRRWIRVLRDGNGTVDLIARIEKVEEDLKSYTTIVQVLSRQLEKLSIRFRVTRKALKGPLAETKALAQKNSQATRALALQEDVLEKELGEIQNVLLAMQEQQQKQLELILAIQNVGRVLQRERDNAKEKTMSSLVDSDSKILEVQTGLGATDNNA